MAKLFSLQLILLLLVLAITIAALRPINSTAQSSPPTNAPSPPPNSSSHQPPLNVIIPPPSLPAATSPPPPSEWEQQLENVIDALLRTGDFRDWAGLLSAATDSFASPLVATLFIPSDDALSHLPSPTAASMVTFDPFIVPYHIVPHRLSFSDLRLFETHTRLPTLLPSNSILITNDSRDNFTVDGSPITLPDLFVNSAVCVHGVKNILDYAVYGVGRGEGGGGGTSDFVFPPPRAPSVSDSAAVDQGPPGFSVPMGEFNANGGDAVGSPINFAFLVVVWATIAWIQG